MAEASTGVGKTRVVLAVAIEKAEAGDTPTVITAPTLAILEHIWEEFEKLKKEKLGHTLKAVFYPAKSEFVDSQALRDYVEESQFYPDDRRDVVVEQWVRDGAPAKNKRALVRAMRDCDAPLCWLMEDLRSMAINLPPDDFALTNDADEDSEGVEILTAVREAAMDADLIFCTHAMLGYAQMSRWAKFPAPRCLIVDEAHQFETNISNIHTSKLSLFGLRRAVQSCRGGTKVSQKNNRELVGLVNNLITNLKGLESHAGKESISLEKGTHGYLIEQTAIILEFLKYKDFQGERKIIEARNTLRDLNRVLAGEVSDKAYLEFSPDRRFPSFVTGRSSVSPILGNIWKTAEGGAVLASATLYTTDQYGNQKCDYLARNLAVPHSRIATPTPVIAPWTVENVTIHTPDSKLAPLLSKPRPQTIEENPAEEIEWISRVGQQITSISQRTRGGTLILATSYAHLDLYSSILPELGINSDRLVFQQRNLRFTNSEEEFKEKYKSGLRPLLFGLGVAWTGVNLRDKSVPEEYDLLATDLIVPCIPIAQNRSNTMKGRVKRMGFDPLGKEALIQLRQGFGRLVRSPLMKDRNIWLLDGRAFKSWKGMKPFRMSIQKTLERYPNKKTFSLLVS